MPRSRSTSSPGSGAQRLPVNPRRHRVPPEQRKRVPTACNGCNIRRVRCSGERPCSQCDAQGRACIYPVAVNKVTIPKSELEELRSKCASLERCLQELVPDQARRQQLVYSNASPRRSSAISLNDTSNYNGGAPLGLGSPAASSSLGDVEEPSSPPEDGRLLQDTDGTARYLGETSGATFLDNLKQFMSTIFPLVLNGSTPEHVTGNTFLASVGRYQTSDSRPLLAPIVNPTWLPSPAEMSVKLSELRYFIQEGGGVSGGILFWGDLSSLPENHNVCAAAQPASTAVDLAAHRSLAFFHAAFAYSSLFGLTTANSKQDGQLGETFFARARILLGNPLEVSTYSSTDIAAMALMALYMVEMNRRDSAYMYITTAMHISIMHGIHRGWSVDELGKRVFWTVYILDRWISCLMGRPPTIMDDAIRLPLPCDVQGLPTSAGLRAHIALSKISGHIVCNTYRIARPSWSDVHPMATSSHVDRALQMLSDWLRDLPPELQMSYEVFSQDRPLCTLHMNYNQLLILTIRPMFLIAVKRAVADRFVVGQQWQQQEHAQDGTQNDLDVPSPPPPQRSPAPFRSRRAGVEDHPQIGLFRECSDAARRNLRLGRWLARASPAGKLLLPDMHCIFNAAIVLLLHQIVFVNLRTHDVSDISFAIEAFAREATAGDTYAIDCLRVMQDLAGLVGRLRALMFDGVPHAPSPNFSPTTVVADPSATPSPLVPPASLPGVLPQGMPVRVPVQPPLPSPVLDGPSPSEYLHPHAHGGGHDGHRHAHHPHQQHHTIAGTGGVSGHQGEMVYDPVMAGTTPGMGMMPFTMPRGDPAYTELMTWLDSSDELNGVYSGQLMLQS